MPDLREGDSVWYYDELRNRHDAIVTAVHGDPSEVWMPCVNLLFTIKDPARRDSHGAQIQRESGVPHWKTQVDPEVEEPTPLGRCYRLSIKLEGL